MEIAQIGGIPSLARAERATEPAQANAELKRVAVELEATFIAEMLKHAGVGEAPEGFGGGIGEEQFGSFLRNEQAKSMAAAGGIGLSEALFNALKERAENV